MQRSYCRRAGHRVRARRDEDRQRRHYYGCERSKGHRRPGKDDSGRAGRPRSRTDTAAATVTTIEENTYVDLGGPSVNVNVPESNGLCGCFPPDPAEFSDRTLSVAPRP
jgi:hypothetical protein